MEIVSECCTGRCAPLPLSCALVAGANTSGICLLCDQNLAWQPFNKAGIYVPTFFINFDNSNIYEPILFCFFYHVTVENGENNKKLRQSNFKYALCTQRIMQMT
jgi:hypothetical protein